MYGFGIGEKIFGENFRNQTLNHGNWQNSESTGSIFTKGNFFTRPNASLFDNYNSEKNSENREYSLSGVDLTEEINDDPPKGKGPEALAKALGITVEKLKSMTPKDVEKLAKQKGINLKEYGKPQK